MQDFKFRDFAFVYDSYLSPGVPFIFPATNVLNRGKVGDGMWTKGWTQGVGTFAAWAKKEFSKELMFPTGIIMVDENFDYQIDFS